MRKHERGGEQIWEKQQAQHLFRMKADMREHKRGGEQTCEKQKFWQIALSKEGRHEKARKRRRADMGKAASPADSSFKRGGHEKA